MKCPVCNSTLKRTYCQKVCLDLCENCKGVWFNADELNQVINHIISNYNLPDAKIDLDKDIVRKAEISENDRICPQCNSKMEKLNFAYDSNIILDKCESCNGIWADDKEVIKLAVFCKGNPILNKMGDAIAKDRGESISRRYSDSLNAPYRGAYSGFGLRIILPLSDDQERSSFPFVVTSIIVINVLVFLLQIIFFTGSSEAKFFFQYGLVPSSAFSSIKGGYSFLTSMFIHGNLWHLLGNMLFLWIFADNIEDRFGHLKFLLLYLCFGVFSDFLHIAMNPLSNIPTIGASGAISGTMGAYFVLYPAAKIKTYFYGKIVDIPSFAYLGGWLIFQILFAYLDDKSPGGGVAWFAHIGGFAAGAVAGLLVKYFASKKTPANKRPEQNPEV